MSQTLTLPDELYRKLAQGAADYGTTVERLLAFVSDAVVMPQRPTKRQRERGRRIEMLLNRYRAKTLTEDDQTELNQLIDADYQDACARADRLIRAKERRRASPSSSALSKPMRK